MAESIDVATARWTKAKSQVENARKQHQANRHSAWHKQRLKMAEQEFNLACLDRQKARENPPAINWEQVNANAEP